MTQRTRILSILLGTLLISFPMLSQPFGGGGRGERSEEGGPRIERLGELLELTADQMEQWQVLTDAHRESARARGETMRNTREQIKDLASTENPNLEQLGRLTLDLHRGQESMKELREEFEGELAAILTPEQQNKFDLLREARDSFGSDTRSREGRRAREGRPGGR